MEATDSMHHLMWHLMGAGLFRDSLSGTGNGATDDYGNEFGYSYGAPSYYTYGHGFGGYEYYEHEWDQDPVWDDDDDGRAYSNIGAGYVNWEGDINGSGQYDGSPW